MGYSNVAGDLNVLSTTSTQNLTVRGDTTFSGNLTATVGYHNFGNVTAANLTVTGNFTVTATNTQVTNALSINNAGTTTALKVVQYEGGIQNVAEFWDFTTLAMVIDPEGNVAIHTTSSPGYSMTVVGGALVDTLTSQLYFGNASGLSNLNSSNLVNPLTSLQLSNTQSNITSLGTLVNLNVSGTANIANGWFTTANITGGLGANTAFFNLLKTNTSNTSFLNASNASVSNLLCSNINVLATANMAAVTVTGVLNGGLLIGNASGLSNINSSNLVGNVASSNAALVVTQPAQPNITSVGVLSALTVAGLLIASDASGLSNVNSSNLVGNVAAANVASSVTNPAQTNITSVGTLNSLDVFTSVTAASFIGSGAALSGLPVANLSGTVNFSNTAGAVTNPSQGNITSVGTLSSLDVFGTVTAATFIGSGAALSALPVANLSGTVNFSNTAGVVVNPAQANITSVGTLSSLDVFGTVTAAAFNGSGAALSALPVANLSGTVNFSNTAGAVTNPAQANITSVGTLSSLDVFTSVTAAAFIGSGAALSALPVANLSGTVNFSNTAGAVTNPAQGNITSVGTLSSLDVFGSVTAATFIGSGAALSALPVANLSGTVNFSNTAGAVTNPAQANITSVGTLSSLDVLGSVTAAAFNGSGAALSALPVANLSGTVNFSNTAGVVVNPAQTNITSVGTLSSLDVFGSVTASTFNGSGAALSSVPVANLSGTVNFSNTAGTVTNPAQANITSVGVLSSLNVFGISNISTLNVSGFANLSSINTASINVANIYTTNIVGFVGSQWTGSVGQPIYYDSGNVAIGSSTVTGANLSVTGNLFVSNALTTSNLILTGTANVQTLNVATRIPITSGLYMNLNATYTLNGTGNWYGNIASTWSSNLYTLFAPNPAASWTTYGSNPLVTGPTGNGGFRFSQTGPWAFTAVITSDNNIKTLALSSNTADVHSNLADTNVWEYVYRTGIGQDPSIPITIPFYVDNTNKYYFLDIETDNQTDNIHRTRYTNAAAEAYTGSYVILRPV